MERKTGIFYNVDEPEKQYTKYKKPTQKTI